MSIYVPVPPFDLWIFECGGARPGLHCSLNENYYLNVGSGAVQPPSTLTPGQANVSQDVYTAIAVAQQVHAAVCHMLPMCIIDAVSHMCWRFIVSCSALGF